MPYITDRVVHDADAHTFEPPGWFDPWVEESLREVMEKLTGARDERVAKLVGKARR